MRESELYFPSHDGASEIRALVWKPNDGTEDGGAVTGNIRARGDVCPRKGIRPRGIIQILHGMAEHIERYRGFAEHLTTNGFIVCGHDYIGHGKSVDGPEKLGVLPPDGKEALVEDAHYLRKLMQARCRPHEPDAAEPVDPIGSTALDAELTAATEPDTPLPYIMLGHSMGSFILRVYLASRAEGLSAAILCGTGHQPAFLSAGGLLIARVQCWAKGPEYRSRLLHSLSIGAYSGQIENARTPQDWLSTDDAVVDAYIADPSCGFMFSTGADIALLSLTGSMVKRKTVEAVPASLPLLFASGKDDPVGEKGEAVKRAVALFRDTGHEDVTLVLYEGMRHEILNEIGKEHVYQDIVDWIDRSIGTIG